MRLSEHFLLSELTASPTATRLGLDNTPTVEVLANLGTLAAALERVRALHGVPLRVNSGYRSPELNAAVGGATNSYHLLGLAADFDPPPGITHAQFREELDTLELFDLIMEEGTAKPEAEGGSRWIHVQLPKPGRVARRLVRLATVDRLGGTITRTEVG